MFKRLLVPLDGSRLAEAVLPATFYLAEHFCATVVLFHVIEQDARAKINGERHLADAAESQAYLDAIATRFTPRCASIEKHVHKLKHADVAHSIIEHAEELATDLIVLCAHGQGGLRDVLVGNIAQQVIARGTVPVFFVRPQDAEREPSFECRKILMPLDGTPHHEPALPVAAEIARACDAVLHLVTVVPTTRTLSAERAGAGMLLPATMTAVLDLAQRGAVEYLQNVMQKLRGEGLQATAEVARGDVTAAVLDAAQRAHADLIVLATHGRTTMNAFWSGSVTPKVLARADAAVLLVRVMGEEAAR